MNIDEKPVGTRGNGNQQHPPHHNQFFNCQPTKLSQPGCWKNPNGDCLQCLIPASKCTGNFSKQK